MRPTLLTLAGLVLSIWLATQLLPLRQSPRVVADPVPAADAAAAPAPGPVQLADEAAPPPADSAPAPPPTIAAPAPPPDLPTVDVKARPVHTVPDYTPAPAPVTVLGRDGNALAPPETVARRAPPAPKQVAAAVISGAARVDNSVSLSVGVRIVPLFGVRAPANGDRCAVAPSPSPRGCGEVARDALAARLRFNATVSCRVPPGQRGGRGAAVCLDSTGVDLAGFLVGAGFALADPAQSYDYVGAETVARSYLRGLWRYR